MLRSYRLKTLGCKANLSDTQTIEAELRARGWVPAPDDEDVPADLCIVNSCTVTDEADRQSRKTATRLKRDNPGAQVVITGCSAEVDPEGLARVKGVDWVVANRDKPNLLDLVLAAAEKAASPRSARPEEDPEPARMLGVAEGYAEMLSRHPMDRDWPAVDSRFRAPGADEDAQSRRTRAFLKIQDGCNSFCTYCVIPYGRGPSRSLGIDAVVAQVAGLVDSGVREVVITGINIGDYGVDWNGGKPAVGRLFREILARTQLERLRVSSLDPVEIDDELLHLMAEEPRFCPHFHVSLQSPHSRVLKLMKRKYDASDVERCLERISRIPAPPGGVFVGMDVITGFPGESEEFFEASREALARLPWSRLHVFPYSERSGTPATRLPGAVPQGERARRAKVLRDLSLERMRAHHQAVLASCQASARPLEDVLVESRVRGPDGDEGWWSGYTRNYLKVLFRSPAVDEPSLSNRILRVRPESLVVDTAAGEVGFIGTPESS